MVDKLVLGKSPGSPAYQNYLATTDWNIWAQQHLENAPIRDQNCQDVRQVSADCPGASCSWKTEIESLLRNITIMSRFLFHWRHLASNLQILHSDELQCAFHLLSFIYNLLITLWGSRVLHIFYTLIPFCFVPIKMVCTKNVNKSKSVNLYLLAWRINFSSQYWQGV